MEHVQTVQSNYYEEYRGPILQVRGKLTNVKLMFFSTDENDEVEESDRFVFDELDTFAATTRGKDKQYLTLTNVGTTAIWCQWLRFPADSDAEYWLANPHESVVPGGLIKTGIRQGLKRDERVTKHICLEFRFNELPTVLLPGQTMDFPIVFRSQQPGYFYETLYLLTHPTLRDSAGRGYAVRLTAVCMNPDLLLDIESDSNTRSGNINELVKETSLDQEARDIMDAILDHALFIDPEYPISLPMMRITAESIFYAHNKRGNYYYETSEKAVSTVSKVLDLLMPVERVEDNPDVCQKSIESMYKLLTTRNAATEMNFENFIKPETEELLEQLATYNNILAQPRRVHYDTANTRKIQGSCATMTGIFDEILEAVENISKTSESLPKNVTEQPENSDQEIRDAEAKQLKFEELLVNGIERIMCAVDAFNAMEDYRPSILQNVRDPNDLRICD